MQRITARVLTRFLDNWLLATGCRLLSLLNHDIFDQSGSAYPLEYDISEFQFPLHALECLLIGRCPPGRAKESS